MDENRAAAAADADATPAVSPPSSSDTLEYATPRFVFPPQLPTFGSSLPTLLESNGTTDEAEEEDDEDGDASSDRNSLDGQFFITPLFDPEDDINNGYRIGGRGGGGRLSRRRMDNASDPCMLTWSTDSDPIMRGTKSARGTKSEPAELYEVVTRPTFNQGASSMFDPMATMDQDTVERFRQYRPTMRLQTQQSSTQASSGELQSAKSRFLSRILPSGNLRTRALKAAARIRNSYFAFWLVTCSGIAIVLDIFSIMIMHFANSHPTSGIASGSSSHSFSSGSGLEPEECNAKSQMVGALYVMGLPNILLIAPILWNEFFALYKEQDDRLIRKPYLLICEVLVSAQICFLAVCAVRAVIALPSILSCHGAYFSSDFLVFISAFVLWGVLWWQIIIFCRFLDHLRLQIDGSNGLSQTSAINNCLRRLMAMPTTTERARKKKMFKKGLYRAVARGDVDAARKLLENAEAIYGITSIKDLYKNPVLWGYAVAQSCKNPLHVAAMRDNLAMVQILIQHGFDVNALDKVVRVNFNLGLLFKICSRLWIRTQDGEESPLKTVLCSVLLPPLHGAVAEGHVHIVRFLIQHGADVNMLPRASFYYRAAVLPPIFVADDPEVLELLVLNGANFLHVALTPLTGLMRTYATPLQRNTFTLRSDLCDYLLECGGDVALTPLHAAAAADDTKQVKALLAMGAEVDTLGEQVNGVHQRTPLHWSAIVGKVATADLLLASGANPNARDRDGRTPLHWAARNNHPEVVSLLLDHGAVANSFDNNGISVLCFAAEAEGVCVPVFSSLISSGASIKHQNSVGDTALHIALQRENRQTAKSLIKCGANMTITNNSGKRAVDCTTSTEMQFELKKEAGSRDIMISYTHTHFEFAHKVREFLENECSLTCWMDTMDPSGIGGGAVWREEIARGIHNCSLVLSIVCGGYMQSEWCLKELALAKIIRKPVLALVVEEPTILSRTTLEKLVPVKNCVSFNNFITSRRSEGPRKILFDVDEVAFGQRWQQILPQMKSIMRNPRFIDEEDGHLLAFCKNDKDMAANSSSTDEEDDGGVLVRSSAVENPGTPSSKISKVWVRVYSHGIDSSLKQRLKLDLNRFGMTCTDFNPHGNIREQLESCRYVIMLIERVDEKDKAVRRQLMAPLNAMLRAAQNCTPSKRVFPVVVRNNFLSFSQMYSLARSDLFYFVDGIGYKRSIGELARQLRGHDVVIPTFRETMAV